jgi:FMN phosphatase YigB (HAD superfamily)
VELWQVYPNDTNAEGRNFDQTHNFLTNDFYKQVQSGFYKETSTQEGSQKSNDRLDEKLENRILMMIMQKKYVVNAEEVREELKRLGEEKCKEYVEDIVHPY